MADAPAVHLIVFSKDRPLQLHGYLTSLFEQWHGDFRVSVLARAEGAYRQAYLDVLHAFVERVDFLVEHTFADGLLALLHDGNAPLTCFGCDDAVFVAPVTMGALTDAFAQTPNLLGISLRLGTTVKRGMWGHAMAQPRFLSGMYEARETHPCPLLWDCTAIGSAGDWAYPWDVVGTVYRTDFVRRVVAAAVAEGRATNPSTLEDEGARTWQRYANGARLLRAWHRPRLVLPTINVVQSTFPNGTVGDDRLDPAFLLECWNRGLRLDTWRYAMGPQPDTWRVGELYLRRAA